MIRHRLYQSIEPLRALGRSIIDTDQLRERRNVIYWDGEAIKNVGETMTGWFRESLTQAGLTDFQRDIVMRNFRDQRLPTNPSCGVKRRDRRRKARRRPEARCPALTLRTARLWERSASR